MDSLDFSTTLRQLRQADDGFSATVAQNWSQGRAGFGGLVAALGVEAIRRATGIDWPLRSLNVAFIGPAMGDVTIDVQRQRQGRSAAFLQATVRTGGEIVATVAACLGPDRDSALSLPAARGPEAPAPEDCMALPQLEGITPTFLKNLDVRIAGGTVFAGSDRPDILWWARHRDEAARSTEAGLIALLDTLPPAGAAMMRRPSPLSSLTWMIDLPGADIATEDGWYLLRSRADYIGGGFSGQSMETWTRDGRLVALHRQSVAIFA